MKPIVVFFEFYEIARHSIIFLTERLISILETLPLFINHPDPVCRNSCILYRFHMLPVIQRIQVPYCFFYNCNFSLKSFSTSYALNSIGIT